MLVNRENLIGIQREIKTTFNKALDTAKPMWSSVAMRVSSATRQNDYTWLGEFPSLREWVGEKVVKSLAAHHYVIINRDFESTVAVKRVDIEDDNVGIYGPQSQMMGEAAAMWPDELVFPLLNDGFTALCYDGQYFFDTDHPVGDQNNPVSFSNKSTIPLGADTLDHAQQSYGALRTQMRKLKNDAGRPLNLNPSTLIVPPALEDTANSLMMNDRLEDGKPNPYKGTAKVVVVQHLTSDTAWFLADMNKPVKPFIFQERKKPVFVSQTDMNNDAVFNLGEYRFGAEARGNAGYGLWQTIQGSTGAGSYA